MSSPSHEHLLGYVLGALEPIEHEQLEREMAKCPELTRQAEALAARLQPLECYRDVESPPAGLAARTCCQIFEHLPEAEKVTPARQGLAGAMRAEYSGESSRWSLSDAIVAAGIFIAAGMLFFPAIANSRYQAQLAQCRNNLRLIGEASQQASMLHPNIDYHNVLNFSGNRAFAGIQPVMFRDQGLLDRDSVVLCPSSPECERRNDFRIPTPQEIDNASPKEIFTLQSQAAGSMAFSLGHLPGEGSDDVSRGSEYLALASDAPSGVVPQLVSSHHDGKGQNVVFASGRTAYVCGCGNDQCGDSLFWNRNLKVEAGLDRSDIVLARGGTRPFANLTPTLYTPNK